VAWLGFYNAAMHIHILGICGTFMGGVAALAQASGHQVTGCDTHVYPPMSDQLEQLGIRLIEGYGADQLALRPDLWVIGNTVSRGNPLMEAILDAGLPYSSGPQWLAEHVLAKRWTLAVAGTHGKTTTTSMLAWILAHAGLKPGFLIGGVPVDFGETARLGEAPFFVVEADEYDTAFFDKRSKFVHYRPRTAVLNNLEYDHADIFPDLGAIETQFHHLVRIVPASGKLLVQAGSPALDRVLARGCWSAVEHFEASPNQGWSAQGDEQHFQVFWQGQFQGQVGWRLMGAHNRVNALAAIAAARHAGVAAGLACEALSCFGGVKRRMEWIGEVRGVTLYDDFAHHPTAMTTTLAGLRRSTAKSGRILAVFEPRSNTMKLGIIKSRLPEALQDADISFAYSGGLDWDLAETLAPLGARARVHADLDALVADIAREARSGDQIVVMSNGSFGGIHAQLLQALCEGSSAAAARPMR
jgi:UDP-N-acetylmuramate: L-alanyl-gamma-D-glutamyl-meso-diaminopimelate ligase